MVKSTAIVTGGSRGIGQAIVERLLDDGFEVITCGRGERPGHLPKEVHWMKADVSVATQAEMIVSNAVQRGGALKLLVNNAGIQVEKTVPQSTDGDWEQVVGINCRGIFNMCRSAIPVMQEHEGAIINIGSISGNFADRSMALYNASKAFVHGLTRSIAVDHGPKIRCNAISPGWIMTAMADDAFALASNPDAAKKDALCRHPVGRFGQPKDIANAVSWLGSKEAAFITGQCITIDGGLTTASPLQPGLF